MTKSSSPWGRAFLFLITIAGICLALALFAGTPVRAANTSGGSRVCDGQYALCSSARCTAIDGDKDHVSCACEGPLKGQNIGDTSCESREQALTSTFSLWDPTPAPGKPAKSSMGCVGANAAPWAFCLDAPCTVKDGKTSCVCALKPASDFYTFASTCPGTDSALKTACGEIWSGASKAELESGYSQLSAMVTDPAPLDYCKKP